MAPSDALEQRRAGATGSRARASADLARLAASTSERDAADGAIAHREQELGHLRRLVEAFGVRGIPARIIEGVLPELSAYSNELLTELRPGMSLAIRAQRARKSGEGQIEALDLVIRDAAGERPLALFSGGERTSIALAVARRAGSAIRTLILDEPDGLDAESRRALGHALRVLSHHGALERIVVVTHTPDLAEWADSTYQVSRDDAGSRVELAA